MREVVVYTFSLGDVEDPEVYVAEPILKWQRTEQGQWIMEHSVQTPMWRRAANHSYLYIYDIVAWLEDTDYTYWALKYQ